MWTDFSSRVMVVRTADTLKPYSASHRFNLEPYTVKHPQPEALHCKLSTLLNVFLFFLRTEFFCSVRAAPNRARIRYALALAFCINLVGGLEWREVYRQMWTGLWSWLHAPSTPAVLNPTPKPGLKLNTGVADKSWDVVGFPKV